MTTFNLRRVQVHLVESLEDVRAFDKWLSGVGPDLGVDTETTGLDPWDPDAAIRLIQFGDHQQGWALPYQQWRGLALEVLNTWSGRFVAHNMAFESRWLYTHGDGYRFPVDRTDDTMIMAKTLYPHKSAALKVLCDEYLDKRASAGQYLLKKGMDEHKWTWATVPIEYPAYWQYGALDPVLTVALKHVLAPHLEGSSPYKNVYNLEMAVRHICSSMEIQGLKIDPEYAGAQADRLEARHDEVIAWGLETYGINVASTKQLGGLVISLGGEIREFTSQGNAKTTKDDLKFWENNGSPELRELAKNVREMRESGKVAESYFLSCLTGMDKEGVVHPEINTMGARTTRMSVSNPPLQQLPSKDPLVRTMFLPRRDGDKILTCDYNQVELRLSAHFSQDPALIEAFRTADETGADFFTLLGAQVYNDPGFTKSDPRRGLIKGLMYGRLYGAGVPKMAATAGVPVEQMEVVAAELNATYPGLDEMSKKIIGIGQDRERYEGAPYVINPLGRRLVADSDRSYALVNYLIQSTAADILKKAIVDLDCAGMGEFMMLPIHDEVLFSVPEDSVEDARRTAGEIMSNLTDYAVSISAEPEGPFSHWGEKYLKKG